MQTTFLRLFCLYHICPVLLQITSQFRYRPSLFSDIQHLSTDDLLLFADCILLRTNCPGLLLQQHPVLLGSIDPVLRTPGGLHG